MWAPDCVTEVWFSSSVSLGAVSSLFPAASQCLVLPAHDTCLRNICWMNECLLTVPSAFSVTSQLYFLIWDLLQKNSQSLPVNLFRFLICFFFLFNNKLSPKQKCSCYANKAMIWNLTEFECYLFPMATATCTCAVDVQLYFIGWRNAMYPISLWACAHYSSWKCKFKPQWDSTMHPPEWPKFKRSTVPSFGKDVEQLELF